jgi:hypothetical protein
LVSRHVGSAAAVVEHEHTHAIRHRSCGRSSAA